MAQQQAAAYLFGVAFVVVMLMIAVLFPRPTVFQVFVFRVVLALAAAGVAAMIPGFLNVELGTAVCAGGAIAVFVIIYFLNPASLVADTEPGPLPKGNPRKVAEEYLQVADSLDFEKTWALFADTAKRVQDKAIVSEAYMNVRIPLGQLSQRQLQGMQSSTSPPGWPAAHYRSFNFLTVFGDGKARGEQVIVMSEDKTWRVAAHTIQTTQ
jgi:hypothetical protein